MIRQIVILVAVLSLSGCIMNSTINIGGTTNFQSPSDNEAFTKKDKKTDVSETEGVRERGLLPFLYDRLIGE